MCILTSVEGHSLNRGPQVFDNYAVTVMIGDDPYTLGLFDTAGRLQFPRARTVLFIESYTDYFTPYQVKKIMIVSDPFPTPKPMSS